jgi:hypothetical protein
VNEGGSTGEWAKLGLVLRHSSVIGFGFSSASSSISVSSAAACMNKDSLNNYIKPLFLSTILSLANPFHPVGFFFKKGPNEGASVGHWKATFDPYREIMDKPLSLN